VTPTIGVADVLARSRQAIHPAMTQAVDRLAPEIRQIAAYHMGWVDTEGHPTDSPGGKGIRPTLALLGAAAAWANPAVGIPGGVAVELVHNFSLIHDDIIDSDTERHHRPTVWSIYGVGPAIVAGDALQVLAHQVLLEGSPQAGAAASAVLAEATAEMIAGQADDISFERRRDVSVEQCTAMSAAKTGALLGCAASIGAVLAGATDVTVGALRDYGRHLGLAFQAIDDLLGIWGDPSRTGKPASSDLRQRKKSMPIVAALAAGGDEAEELRHLIVGPAGSDAPLAPMTADEVDRARFLVESCGGRQWTAVRAKANLDAALGALDRVRLEAVAHRDLADIAVYVVERDL
jgi:geranylgeranyl diphosphate synthase type I